MFKYFMTRKKLIEELKLEAILNWKNDRFEQGRTEGYDEGFKKGSVDYESIHKKYRKLMKCYIADTDKYLKGVNNDN